MQISVDHDRCEGHGLCETRAPQVYELDDDGVVVYRFEGRDVPAELEIPAADGAAVCPVAALTVVR
ncbi:ferredoxin [Pseudonocardia sp. KRD291]|uniref:ferredoxin n=1 Tax=Pseudonocardia sp. KRD291 TaxID=2792007 RepID=UPI001C4A23B9|nr:ferredoxin [Pseudonocardia sp. KRD291]MBW0104445.1 ferredoxin [Pseudonocardia sp. KRD291]